MLIVTIAPSAIIAVSNDPGTLLFAHVAGSVHKPPVVEEATLPGVVVTKVKNCCDERSTGVGNPGTTAAVVLETLVPV